MRFYDLGATTVAITLIVLGVSTTAFYIQEQGKRKKLEDHLKNQPTFCDTAEGYRLGYCQENNTAEAREALYNFYNALRKENNLPPEENLPTNPYTEPLETLETALEDLEYPPAFDEEAAEKRIDQRLADIVAQEKQGNSNDKSYEELKTASEAFYDGKKRNGQRQEKIMALKTKATSWGYAFSFDPESNDSRYALEDWLAERKKQYYEANIAPIEAALSAIQQAHTTAKNWPPSSPPQSQIVFDQQCRTQDNSTADDYSTSTPAPCDEALSPKDQQQLERLKQEITTKLSTEDRAVMRVLSQLPRDKSLADTVKNQWLAPLDAKNVSYSPSFTDFVNAFTRN